MGTAGSAISKVLASAHKTLDSANKFQNSTGGPMYHHTEAPYAVAHEASKKASSTPTTGDELAAKKENVENYVKNTNTD